MTQFHSVTSFGRVYTVAPCRPWPAALPFQPQQSKHPSGEMPANYFWLDIMSQNLMLMYVFG